MQFRVNVKDVLRGLGNAQSRYLRGTALYGQTAAIKMEAYAKAHRPWTDRTGNARSTIKGIYGWGSVSANVHADSEGYVNASGETVDDAGEYVDTSIPHTSHYPTYYPLGSSGNSGSSGGDSHTFVIGVSGNMNYSPFLEYAHGQKYAILKKAVNACAAETINGWAAMMRALH